MKLLITIVNKGKCSLVTEICHKFKIDFQTVYTGKGTASSERLEMLSLGETEKEIILSLVSDKDIEFILNELNQSIDFNKVGSGVAFSVQLDSIGSSTYQYLMEGLGGLTNGK